MKFNILNLVEVLIANFLKDYLLVKKTDFKVPVEEVPVEQRYGLDGEDDIAIKNKSDVSSRVKYLVLHTTAGNPNTTAAQIQDYFLRPERLGGRGWRKGGYHLIIENTGAINRMYHDSKKTNGIIPKRQFKKILSNSNTIHISYVGGINLKTMQPEDTRTEEQIKSLLKLIKYYIDNYPDIKILGHNQVAAKACPSFDVISFLKANNVPEKNIAYFQTKTALK